MGNTTRFNENLRFEQFYEVALQWFSSSKAHSQGYLIVDLNTFKSLLHTFYYVSMKEMSNILRKRESDERFAIT